MRGRKEKVSMISVSLKCKMTFSRMKCNIFSMKKREDGESLLLQPTRRNGDSSLSLTAYLSGAATHSESLE